jgi:methionyl-tRNA synthetase
MLTETFSLGDLAIRHPLFVLILVAWSLAWKGAALWKSANLRQKKWFIAILLINLFGLLEIIYLYFVARKYKVEVVER